MTSPAKKDAVKPARTFVFIDDGAVPKGALVCQNGRGRSLALIQWRRAVMAFAPKQTRVLRIAWLLHGLFANARSGFAFIGDSGIAKETGIDDAHIAATLAELEGAGLLIRRHVRKGTMTQRRIWPALPTAAAAVEPVPLPQSKSYRYGGGTEKEDKRGTRLSYTMLAAKREAEARVARELGKSPDWLEDRCETAENHTPD